jgi:peptidyl-prolyl cis-trans isomerase SurA
MTRTRTILCAAGLLACAAPLVAQQPAPPAERVGYIVAVVGDSAILNFDLDQGLLARQAQLRQPVPEPGPLREQLMQEVLQERISELLLLQAALRDTTIRTPDDQIARAVQQEIETRQRELGGPAQFEQAVRASGLTMQAYTEMLTQQQRRGALIGQYLERMRRDRTAPPVSEAEIRQAYDAAREGFDERPATVTVQRIAIDTEPSAAALARTRARADSIYMRVIAREDFAQLARRHSDDPASREQGGDLGFFRRSDMVREFANVAFAMGPGQVSPPVRTRFGYHIIKVERIRGAEVQARHILLAHEITVDDAARARVRADSVAEQLRRGADAAALARQFGNTEEQLRVGPLPLDYARQALDTDFTDAQVGEVLGPTPIGGDDVARQFQVVRVVEREAPRPWTLTDPQLRENLRQRVQQEKQVEEILAELRRRTYVEVRGPR